MTRTKMAWVGISAALVCGTATSSERRPSPEVDGAIAAAAVRHGLRVSLLRAVVRVESNFHANAVSHKGARGLTQLMPETARSQGLTRPEWSFDPILNLDAGARELRRLINVHQGNVALALASYNAGRGAVARHGDRIPPYPETMLYVPAVLAAEAREGQ